MGLGARKASMKKSDKNPGPCGVYNLVEKMNIEQNGQVDYIEHHLW